MQYQADINWVGLLFVVGAVLYKLFQGYQRGDVETEGQAQRPSSPPSPQPQRPPVPVQRSQPTPGKSLEQVFQELSRGLESGYPGGLPTQSRPIPPTVYSKPRQSLQRVPIVESQSPSLQDDPAGLISRAGNPLYQTSVERSAIPIGDVPIVTSSQESEINHFAWLRDRLRDRSETQRAIILSEVMQLPVAMR